MGGRCRLPPLCLQLQQQVAQLGALAGKACLGSLAHPPPLADLLGVRAKVQQSLQRYFHRSGMLLQESLDSRPTFRAAETRISLGTKSLE